MKKTFVVLSLMMFIGAMTSTAVAASNGTKIEVVKKDDKKKKKAKKAKKGSCCASGTTEKKSCHTENEKK